MLTKAGIPNLYLMQDLREVKVRENEDSEITFDTLSLLPSKSTNN